MFIYDAAFWNYGKVVVHVMWFLFSPDYEPFCKTPALL